MLKKVIILNAAPNSGKDVAADYMNKNYGFEHVEFKEKLFELVKVIYSLTDETWNELYTRELKEKKNLLLDNLSPRESLIKVSEQVIKPNYGPEYFGKTLSKKISTSDNNVFVVSDGGFIEEVNPVVRAVGAENLMIIRIHRPECTFATDSRSFLPDITGVTILDINNESTLDEFLRSVETAIMEFVQYGSQLH